MIIYIDMDGVLANFDKHVKEPRDAGTGIPPEMLEPGFFKNLEVMSGAKEAIDELCRIPNTELYIATKISTKNLYSPTEKFEWIQMHFPMFLKRMFITCDKTKLIGDYLIDDDMRWKNFKGTFIHFDKHNPEKAWEYAVRLIKNSIAK